MGLGSSSPVLSRECYLQRYPSGHFSTYSNKKNLSPFVSRLEDLYISTTFKWIEHLKNGFFCTVNISGKKESSELSADPRYYKRKYPLVFNDLYLHLTYEKNIGVFPDKEESKFLIFDIDSLDFNIVRTVYTHLAQHFKEDFINIHYSGSKGYHISLFFDEMIERVKLQKFFNYIVYLLSNDLSKRDISKIECRGGASELAVKLPLGYNYSNEKNGETFYVDFNGNRLSNEYLFSIQKIPVQDFDDVFSLNVNSNYKTYKIKKYIENLDEIDCEKEQRNEKKKSHNFAVSQEEYIERKKKQGIDAEGTRHKVMFQITISLRDAGFTANEAVKYLDEWHKILDKSLYKSSGRAISNDIISTINNVYSHPEYCLQKKAHIELSEAEFEEIMSVPDKTLRRLYFILFSQFKSLSVDENFYMTYQQMAELGATQNRGRLKEQLEELQKMKKIKIVSSNIMKPKDEREHATDFKYPNVYKLSCFNKTKITEKNICYKLNVTNMEKDFLDMVAKKIFIPEKLKKYYKKNQLTKLKKLDNSSIKLDKVEIDAIWIKVIERTEIETVKNEELKQAYILLILNAIIGNSVEKNNAFDFTGFYRSKIDKKFNNFNKIIEELEKIGKIKIIKRYQFFFEYKLLVFQKRSVNVREYLEKLE